MPTFEARKGKFVLTTTSAVEAENLRGRGYEVTKKPAPKPAQKDTK